MGVGGGVVHMCIVPKREDERVEDERKSRRSPHMSPLSIIQITAWNRSLTRNIWTLS